MNARVNQAVRVLMSLAVVIIINAASDTAKADGGRVYYTQLTSSEYQNLFDVLVPQGYRVTYARGYNYNGQARYDVEMYQMSGPRWATYHGMTDCRFREKSNYYFQNGYQMTHHSAYRVNGQLRHLAIWVQR